MYSLQSTEQKQISFIDVLTRNLFLFTMMCVCIAFGVAVRLLTIDSLDTYIIQIKSDRLDFIFFIGVAACYLSLLFILIDRSLLNFIVQLMVSGILFVLLLFVFSPPLTVKSYLFNKHVEFSTRAWEDIKVLPFGKSEECIKWQEMDKSKKHALSQNTISPRSCNYYFFSFIFTCYSPLSLKDADKK